MSSALSTEIPYSYLPDVAVFSLTSEDMTNGSRLSLAQVSGVLGAGGEDISPSLEWSGFPEETASFCVTCFDPDAPTGSGFWHWAVVDVPVGVTSLPKGAGALGGVILPHSAFMLKGDGGLAQYIGAAPPEGHGEHRYVFAVHAVDVPTLGIDAEVTPAVLGFNLFFHTIGRALLVATYSRP